MHEAHCNLITAYQIQLFVCEVHLITNEVSFILVGEHKLNVLGTLMGCSNHPGVCVCVCVCVGCGLLISVLQAVCYLYNCVLHSVIRLDS